MGVVSLTIVLRPWESFGTEVRDRTQTSANRRVFCEERLPHVCFQLHNPGGQERYVGAVRPPILGT